MLVNIMQIEKRDYHPLFSKIIKLFKQSYRLNHHPLAHLGLGF
jgi:hypothetical protein